MNKTAAVVVTYNRKELLTDCLQHIKSQTEPADIIVVDNASTDGTSDLFVENTEGLLYFNTGANLGGAGGFNYGMRKACELGYEFVWIMDDDTMPEPTAHEKLLEADKKLCGEYGWLSSLALWKDKTPCNMNIQKITKWKPLKSFNETQKIQYASFVSLFLKVDTVKRYGLPYKEFFIWSDDWEYTRRISKQENCYFIPESLVFHFCKSNTGADIVSADADMLERFSYLYRNDVVLYRQDGLDGFVYMVLRITKHIFKILLKTDYKAKKIRLMFISLKDGLKFKPYIERV